MSHHINSVLNSHWGRVEVIHCYIYSIRLFTVCGRSQCDALETTSTHPLVEDLEVQYCVLSSTNSEIGTNCHQNHTCKQYLSTRITFCLLNVDEKWCYRPALKKAVDFWRSCLVLLSVSQPSLPLATSKLLQTTFFPSFLSLSLPLSSLAHNKCLLSSSSICFQF